MYDNQLKSLLERLENFEKQIESEAEFSCEKINSQCPFIRVINKQHFEQREVEKKKILEEKESLEQRVKSEDFDKKLEDIKKKLENPESTSQDEKKQIKDDQSKNIKAMDLLRDFLKVVDYKKIDELNESFKKKFYLLVWLCLGLAVAPGIFHLRCIFRDLQLLHVEFLSRSNVGSSSQPGIKPKPPELGARSLSHWTTREAP
jgi:hypothetical protein